MTASKATIVYNIYETTISYEQLDDAVTSLDLREDLIDINTENMGRLIKVKCLID